MVELLVTNRVLFGPVEVDRTHAFVNPHHLAIVATDRELRSVAAVMKQNPISVLNPFNQPLQAIQDSIRGGTRVGHQPNVTLIETTMTDQEVGHVSYVVNAAP